MNLFSEADRRSRVCADVSSAFFPGCTDMVRMWTGLGFVERNDSGPLPIWIETERHMARGYRYAPPPEQTVKLT